MSGMRYRPVGRSGLVVSAVGLGCNNFGGRLDLEATRAVVDAALEVGITLFDTADIYGGARSEEILGEALAGRRDRVVLATKFGMDMAGRNGEDLGARGSRRYIARSVESSLRRLGTDWIDLYQYHVPDGITPVEETLSALDELVIQGKVRYLGSSNFAAWQVADADWVARTAHQNRFISAQNNYSLLDRRIESELVPACLRFGVGILPYFPLANGLLSGKYERGKSPPAGSRLGGRPGALDERSFERLAPIQDLAEALGRTLLEVAVAGLAAQPAVASVIAGATTPQQVRANAAAGAWVLTPDELAALDRAARSRRPA
ncbi:MAG: aldo/keto reductase [Candidatus Dormibacteria bacterium]